MKWVKCNNGDWKAVGERGDFLIWKIRRGFYKARYRSNDKSITFVAALGTIREVKKRCENNFYWE